MTDTTQELLDHLRDLDRDAPGGEKKGLFLLDLTLFLSNPREGAPRHDLARENGRVVLRVLDEDGGVTKKVGVTRIEDGTEVIRPSPRLRTHMRRMDGDVEEPTDMEMKLSMLTILPEETWDFGPEKFDSFEQFVRAGVKESWDLDEFNDVGYLALKRLLPLVVLGRQPESHGELLDAVLDHLRKHDAVPKGTFDMTGNDTTGDDA